jgi:hypothetical protein
MLSEQTKHLIRVAAISISELTEERLPMIAPAVVDADVIFHVDSENRIEPIAGKVPDGGVFRYIAFKGRCDAALSLCSRFRRSAV